jgi:hypothetical protein
VTAVAWSAQLRLARGLAEAAASEPEFPGLGPRPLPPLRLIVVADGRRFRALARGGVPPWGAGLAAPESRTILLRADAEDLPQVLRHELAHLALHQAVRVRVPLWFDEGYATWAAGGVEAFDVLRLNLAVARGAVPDLGGLDAALRGSAASAEAAYPLAATAVAELARRHPERSLRPLLERLEGGEDFEVAVRETTGLNFGQFETAWRRTIRLRYGLLVWTLAAGLWAALAMAVLGGAWLRRLLDRPRRAALDVGWIVPDETEPVPPPVGPGPEPGDASELDRRPDQV